LLLRSNVATEAQNRQYHFLQGAFSMYWRRPCHLAVLGPISKNRTVLESPTSDEFRCVTRFPNFFT
jgi:hypothetical protein